MEEVTVSQNSKDYWRRIQLCIQNVCREIVDDCYDKLNKDYEANFRDNISRYYASMKNDDFDDYIKEDIRRFILELPTKDKVLLRAAQYQLGDELSAKTEIDRMVEFIICGFSSRM